MQTWLVKAKELEYDIVHIWEIPDYFKAQKLALDLAHNNWREISITLK